MSDPTIDREPTSESEENGVASADSAADLTEAPAAATEMAENAEATEETEGPEDTEDADKAPKEGFISVFFDYMEIVVLSICAVLVLFTLVGRLCRVNGSSMRNTLYDGELLITTSLVTPEAGDIIVFHQTADETASARALNEPLVKRIIATEGQTIRIDYRAGEVSVDGVPLDESAYIALLHPATNQPIGAWTQAPGHHFDYVEGVFEAKVPDGCLFVMGDNRNNSADSRSNEVAFVDARRVLGKVVMRVKPFTVFD